MQIPNDIFDGKRTGGEASIIHTKNINFFLGALKNYYIRERNKILGSIFKYYNPYYRWKLKKIDEKLDEIEEAFKRT